jgi:AAA domain
MAAATSGLQLVQPQPVPWLWPGRIAAGRLALIDGDPEQGKSLLTLDLAARLTVAGELPDGYRPPAPVGVLLLAGGEDNLADTVVPRLRAAGADLHHVQAWQNPSGEPPVFPEACSQLQEVIKDTGARLVLFDPFFAYLGPDIGSLNDLMIRRALGPLARVAEGTEAAFVLIRHLAKGSAGKAACYRGLGSMAILGAMRTAFLVARDPDDTELRVFACTKSNLARYPPSLGFRIVTTGEGLPRLAWVGPVERTADDLVGAGRRRGESVPRAILFLQAQLESGWKERQALMEQAGREGISFRTLERAKAELHVVSRQRREHGRNVWYWGLLDRR